MKLLFVTTLSVAPEQEHNFTKNVMRELASRSNDDFEFEIATISLSPQASSVPAVVHSEYEGIPHHTLILDSNSQQESMVLHIADFFRNLHPDVIHSQMIEGYDVCAAKKIGIPIVVTIHIGGFICPRGGGNGFLKYNDNICDKPVNSDCYKCMLSDIPVPHIANVLYRSLKLSGLNRFFAERRSPILYLSPVSAIDIRIKERKTVIEHFKYAHIIAANNRLVELLSLNGLKDRVHLIPHGVRERKALPLPDVGNGLVKFYILGRIQHSKGIHNVIKAFDGICNSRYELHIIGDAEPARREQRYFRQIQKLAAGKNVIFHGRLPNEDIERIIGDCHVMIHPAIFLEVYGIAIAESLSIGRPVIATRCGGAEMQVKDGRNGWLVKPNDVESIRRSITTILENPDTIKERAANCHLPHPLPEYADELIRLYNSIQYEN